MKGNLKIINDWPCTCSSINSYGTNLCCYVLQCTPLHMHFVAGCCVPLSANYSCSSPPGSWCPGAAGVQMSEQKCLGWQTEHLPGGPNIRLFWLMLLLHTQCCFFPGFFVVVVSFFVFVLLPRNPSSNFCLFTANLQHRAHVIPHVWFVATQRGLQQTAHACM